MGLRFSATRWPFCFGKHVQKNAFTNGRDSFFLESMGRSTERNRECIDSVYRQFVRLCVYLRRPFSLLFVCHGDLCFINRVGTSNLQQILEFFIIYFEGSIYIVPFILCEKRNIVLSLCLDGKSKSSGSRFLCVCFFEYFVLREKRSAIILLISFSLLS